MCVCVCVHLGAMSLEKVKSELSPDGALKLTIKREKTTNDACKPEWVTEARGHGLGKLVIKRKSPGSVCQLPEAAGLHIDRQTEQRPILRLSLTSTTSGDGNRHTQVKSWSLCEVPSAVEDVASASELSPACQLQSSPKDSGIDMSSPPHDDAAVGVEPNAAAGIWTAAESHSGDSSAVDVEKMTSSLDKLETTVASIVHADIATHSSSTELWSDTASLSRESDSQTRVQSTLRSRGECSALKSFTASSQKLVNPLAKSRRVGRYQHMLPVNRIRAESNIARRSSLEESPTYNMVTSRTSLFSPLPRVRTKLKLLSNNTYAPVFDQERESNEQCTAAQASKCSNVEKSPSGVAEHKRKRLLHKSSTSDAFENVKVKLCCSGKNHGNLGDDKAQKLRKWKVVVKPEPALSVSRVERQLTSSSVVASVKQAEENRPRPVRRKRSQREIGKMKDSVSSKSAVSPRAVDGSNTNHFKSTDSRSSHLKRTSLEAKHVVDWAPVGKKSKLKDSAEQLASQSRESSVSQKSPADDHVVDAKQSVDGKTSDDIAACDVMTSLSSLHTGEPTAGQSSVCDVSLKAHTVVEEETRKCESVLAAETKLPAVSAESEPDGLGAIHSGTEKVDKEQYCTEGSSFDSEKCTVLNSLNVNADDDSKSTVIVDQHCEGKLSLVDDSVGIIKEDMLTAEQHYATSIECSTVRHEEALIDRKPCVTSTSVHDDDTLDEDLPSDESGKSDHTCTVFDDKSTCDTVEQQSAVCVDSEAPLLLSPSLCRDDSVTENTDCANSASVLLLYSNVCESSEAQHSNLLTLQPAVVSDDTLPCVAVDSQDHVGDIDDAIKSAKPCFQDTECQQDCKCQVAEIRELHEENSYSKSICSVPEQHPEPADEGEQRDSDAAYLFDTPVHLTPSSAPCYSKEHKETAVTNSASSNGFLAVFAKFVEKACVKKKSASCKVTEVDNTLTANEQSADETPLKPGSHQKRVRRRPFRSERRRNTSLEKQTLPENRLQCHVAQCQSIKTVECVSGKETSLPEVYRLEDIDCSERLSCSTVDDDRPILCREDILSAVSADCQLVTLRRRVCELLETVLPDLQFPSGFQRDSASVERFIKDITDVLSNSEMHTPDIQRCSDPVVTLHSMPDRCLQSLQQQIIRLLSLLLPDTDLSDISGDSLDVFLEWMTSINRPLPGTFCASQLDLNHQTIPQPLDAYQLHDQPSLPVHADADIRCGPFDTSAAMNRTEIHMPPVDTLFNMPSSLISINSPGPVGDKRSIRRQVKDCLLLLDRDLT